MRITQLREGQERQIARLHTRTILRLYTPLSVEEAIRVPNHGLSSLPHHQGEPGVVKKEGGIPATHELRKAAPYGDIVIQFEDTAEHLSVPKVYNTTGTHAMAEEKYPESQMPLVSWLLLEDDEPSVYYHSILSSNSIMAYHLIGYHTNGSPAHGFSVKDSLKHREFEVWAVNKYQKYRKTGGNPRY